MTPTVADGAIAVTYLDPPLVVDERLVDAPLDHPHIARAVELVRRWPSAFVELKRYVHTLHPLLDRSIPPGHLPYVLGSSSHSEEARPGAVTLTVHDPLGAAQALVHEMAHHKLRSLGVFVERAARLITNDPATLYESPIRKDRRRPMTAVFHAEYSFTYVAALDLEMLAQEEDPDTRDRMLMLLARNVPRLAFGLEQIEQHIRTDEEGAAFVGAFRAWAAEVIGRGNRTLAAHGYGMPSLGPRIRAQPLSRWW